jgi:thymidylate synthase (FAD)
MKILDHGFINVVDIMGNDAAIVQAARVSYGDGTKTTREDKALINYLMRNKHSSPFEMCEIKLHIKMPLFIARQWVRHRTASINECSARYSIMVDEFYVPTEVYTQSKTNKQGSGEVINDPEIQEIIENNNKETYLNYLRLLTKGVSRETARILLPVNIYTQWYWKINLHNLLHFLKLRLHPHAQWEIQQYAQGIATIVEEHWPQTWEAFNNNQS